jgi:hypothetical protein
MEWNKRILSTVHSATVYFVHADESSRWSSQMYVDRCMTRAQRSFGKSMYQIVDTESLTLSQGPDKFIRIQPSRTRYMGLLAGQVRVGHCDDHNLADIIGATFGFAKKEFLRRCFVPSFAFRYSIRDLPLGTQVFLHGGLLAPITHDDTELEDFPMEQLVEEWGDAVGLDVADGVHALTSYHRFDGALSDLRGYVDWANEVSFFNEEMTAQQQRELLNAWIDGPHWLHALRQLNPYL